MTLAPYVAGNGLAISSGIINIGSGNGITVNADNIQINYPQVVTTIGGAGLTANGNVLDIGVAVGNDTSLTIQGDGLRLDKTTLANNLLLNGTASSLTASSGNLQVMIDGTTITRDSSGALVANITSAVGLAGNGLTSSGSTLNVNVNNGIAIVNDFLQIDQLLAGRGLTYSSGVIDINVAKGVTISGDALFSDATTITTTLNLPFINIATNSSIQSALSAIDTALISAGSQYEVVVSNNPTGTFLPSINIPVQLNSGITFSTPSYGSVEVFINGLYVKPGGSSASAVFFSTNGVTGSSTVFVGASLWSNVSKIIHQIG